MPKIMEIIEKETKGKSYHAYKYSYDSIGVPSKEYELSRKRIIRTSIFKGEFSLSLC